MNRDDKHPLNADLTFEFPFRCIAIRNNISNVEQCQGKNVI